MIKALAKGKVLKVLASVNDYLSVFLRFI